MGWIMSGRGGVFYVSGARVKSVNQWWWRHRYDLYAPMYDALTKRVFRHARQRSLALVDVELGQKWLLLGCGSGQDLALVPEQVTVIAADLSWPMLCKARAYQRGLLVQMNAERVGLASQSMDVVVLHLILAVVPNPGALLAEVCRILKPGGQVIIMDKLLVPGQQPSRWRRCFNPIAKVIATDLCLSLESLLESLPLTLKSQQGVLAGGVFRAIKLQRQL